MYLPNIEYFITIVECRNLSHAAETLNVSQPSLSQYLRRLEKNLGTQLFDHSTSPLKLTYAGERYYQYVQMIRQLDNNLRKEFEDIEQNISGKVRLGLPSWRSSCFIPDFFPQFMAKYPSISIEIEDGSTPHLEKALLDEKIDLALLPIPHNMELPKVVAEVLVNEPILLAAPTNHPQVQKILSSCSYIHDYPIAPASLINELPLVVSKPGQHLRILTDHYIAARNLQPRILLENNALTASLGLVSKGVCCSFLPAEGTHLFKPMQNVTFFYLNDNDLQWPLAACYKKGTYLPKTVRCMIDEMKLLFNTRDFLID